MPDNSGGPNQEIITNILTSPGPTEGKPLPGSFELRSAPDQIVKVATWRCWGCRFFDPHDEIGGIFWPSNLCPSACRIFSFLALGWVSRELYLQVIDSKSEDCPQSDLQGNCPSVHVTGLTQIEAKEAAWRPSRLKGVISATPVLDEILRGSKLQIQLGKFPKEAANEP